jgi:hypothetical protein
MNDTNELDIIQIKQYICKVCLELDKANLISILNFLKKEHIENNLLNQNNDGIKVNLDLISDEFNLKLYKYIKYKLSN